VFIASLEYVGKEVPPSVATIRIVLDNLIMQKGKQLQAWLGKHPRFVIHYPPGPLFVGELRRAVVQHRQAEAIGDR